jgi:hypothetical protein
LNQQRQNAITTKVKEPKVIMTEPDLDQGIKTQYVYAATIDAGQIYTDQTGRFTVVSSKGNKYIMIYMIMTAIPSWHSPSKTEQPLNY